MTYILCFFKKLMKKERQKKNQKKKPTVYREMNSV